MSPTNRLFCRRVSFSQILQVVNLAWRSKFSSEFCGGGQGLGQDLRLLKEQQTGHILLGAPSTAVCNSVPMSHHPSH